MKESNPLMKRRAVISIILLTVAACQFIRGVTYTTSWSQTEALTRATYYVGSMHAFDVLPAPPSVTAQFSG